MFDEKFICDCKREYDTLEEVVACGKRGHVESDERFPEPLAGAYVVTPENSKLFVSFKGRMAELEHTLTVIAEACEEQVHDAKQQPHTPSWPLEDDLVRFIEETGKRVRTVINLVANTKVREQGQ